MKNKDLQNADATIRKCIICGEEFKSFFGEVLCIACRAEQSILDEFE